MQRTSAVFFREDVKASARCLTEVSQMLPCYVGEARLFRVGLFFSRDLKCDEILGLTVKFLATRANGELSVLLFIGLITILSGVD